MPPAWPRFEDALRIDPKLSGAYNGIGIVLQEQNRHDEAAESFRKAVELQPHFSEALNNLAISMQGLGRVPEAIHYYREVLVNSPERSEVYLNLGSLLQSIARYDESIVIFNQALVVRPDNQDIYPYLAHSLMQTCAWSNLEAVTAKVIENVELEVGKGSHVSVSPFGLQGMPASMELRHKVARHVSAKAAAKITTSANRCASCTSHRAARSSRSAMSRPISGFTASASPSAASCRPTTAGASRRMAIRSPI